MISYLLIKILGVIYRHSGQQTNRIKMYDAEFWGIRDFLNHFLACAGDINGKHGNPCCSADTVGKSVFTDGLTTTKSVFTFGVGMHSGPRIPTKSHVNAAKDPQ